MAQVDALEVFGGTVSGFIKRLLVFLSAGWVGYGLGIFASLITDWSDLMTLPKFDLQLGPFEMATMFLWPISQLLLIGTAPVLTLVAILLTLGMFIAYVYSDGEPILWWAGLTLSTSLLAVRAEIGMEVAPPYVVLAIFWSGLISASYYFYRRAYPNGFARVGAILSGQKSDPDDGYESISKIKARLEEEEAALEEHR